MKFTTRFFAISATVSQVLALPELTNSAYSVTEGKPFTITWANANGPVTLLLKDGASNDLKTVTTIAAGVTGTSFTWTPTGLASDEYAIAISDSTGTNYSPQFPYAGTGTVSITSSSATTAAATTTTAKDSSSSAVSTVMSTTTSSGSSSAPSSSSAANSSTTASSSSNSTTTASSTTLSKATSSSTATSTSSSSTSTTTPVNTNDSKKLGSSLAFVVLTAAALLVCH